MGASAHIMTQDFHQALQQSTMAVTVSSDIQEPASEVVSALLSAESEQLATQEGDTKSRLNQFLSPALWSNASLAVLLFDHMSAVTLG